MSYPKISNNGRYHLCESAYFRKLRPDAQEPFKADDNIIEPSWTVTLIGREDNRAEDILNDVNVFTTGITLLPPIGHHFELVPDKSLFSMGYFFPGPLVLSPNDENEVEIPLIKFKEGDDLSLPFTGCQLVLRETVLTNLASSISSVKNESVAQPTVYSRRRRQEVKDEEEEVIRKTPSGRARKMF